MCSYSYSLCIRLLTLALLSSTILFADIITATTQQSSQTNSQSQLLRKLLQPPSIHIYFEDFNQEVHGPIEIFGDTTIGDFKEQIQNVIGIDQNYFDFEYNEHGAIITVADEMTTTTTTTTTTTAMTFFPQDMPFAELGIADNSILQLRAKHTNNAAAVARSQAIDARLFGRRIDSYTRHLQIAVETHDFDLLHLICAAHMLDSNQIMHNMFYTNDIRVLSDLIGNADSDSDCNGIASVNAILPIPWPSPSSARPQSAAVPGVRGILKPQIHQTNPLQYYISLNNVQIVSYLIDHCGADMDASLPLHYPHPLMSAVMHNYIEIAEFLLARGALFTGKDELIAAVRNDNIDMAHLLIEAGVNRGMYLGDDHDHHIAFDLYADSDLPSVADYAISDQMLELLMNAGLINEHAVNLARARNSQQVLTHPTGWKRFTNLLGRKSR